MGRGQGVVVDTTELETESLRITLVVMSLRGVLVMVTQRQVMQPVITFGLVTGCPLGP